MIEPPHLLVILVCFKRNGIVEFYGSRSQRDSEASSTRQPHVSPQGRQEGTREGNYKHTNIAPPRCKLAVIVDLQNIAPPRCKLAVIVDLQTRIW